MYDYKRRRDMSACILALGKDRVCTTGPRGYDYMRYLYAQKIFAAAHFVMQRLVCDHQKSENAEGLFYTLSFE